MTGWSKVLRTADAFFYQWANGDAANTVLRICIAIYALFVNALHRHHSTGHHRVTVNMSDPTSPAFKASAVSGARREQLATYTGRYGHDLWHHLAQDSMNSLCDAIAGNPCNSEACDAKTPVGYVWESKRAGNKYVRHLGKVSEAPKA